MDEKHLAIWDSLTPKQQETLRSIEITEDGAYYAFEVLEHMGLAYSHHTTSSNEKYRLTPLGRSVLIAYREKRNYDLFN